jgi:Protein of unknown function (DUF2914)
MNQNYSNIRIRRFFRFAILTCFAMFLMGARQSLAVTCDKKDEAKILRAIFTTRLENREPVDRVLIVDNKVREIFFFTDLSQLQGHTITHRWEYEGRVVQTRSYQIKGQRWRVASQKELDPGMIGRWSVVVTDENDCPLKAVVFQLVPHSATQNQTAILPLE